MSKITSNTCTVYLVTSLFCTLEKISKEVMFHTICVNYEAKIEAEAVAGTGAGTKRRFRLKPNTRAPAMKP